MPILGERFPQRSHCLEYTVNGVSGPSVCYIYFIFFFFTGWQVSSNVMGLYISYIRYMKTCFMCACMKSLQLCLTLCDPVDHSLPDSSVHGIFQARTMEWVAIPLGDLSSRGSSQPRDGTCISCDSCITGGFFTTEPPGKTWMEISKWYLLPTCPTELTVGGKQ